MYSFNLSVHHPVFHLLIHFSLLYLAFHCREKRWTPVDGSFICSVLKKFFGSPCDGTPDLQVAEYGIFTTRFVVHAITKQILLIITLKRVFTL